MTGKKSLTKEQKAYRKHVRPAGMFLPVYGVVLMTVAAFGSEKIFTYFPVAFVESLAAKRLFMGMVAALMIPIGVGLFKKKRWGFWGLLAFILFLYAYISVNTALGHMPENLPFGLSPTGFILFNLAQAALASLTLYYFHKPVFFGVKPITKMESIPNE